MKFTVLAILALAGNLAIAQESPDRAPLDQPKQDAPSPVEAAVRADLNSSGTGKIVIEASGIPPELPSLFSARCESKIKVGAERVTQSIAIHLAILQGKPETLTLELVGDGVVQKVTGKHLLSWAVRHQNGRRYLDLRPAPDAKEIDATATIHSPKYALPSEQPLTHLAVGKAVGFASVLNLEFDAAVHASLAEVDGFLPLATEMDGKNRNTRHLQFFDGGKVVVKIERAGASGPSAVLLQSEVIANVLPGEQAVGLQLRGTAHVREKDTVLPILAGNIALESPSPSDDYEIRLDATDSQLRRYALFFPNPGQFPIEVKFSTPLEAGDERQAISCQILGGAVTPMRLDNLGADLEFGSDSTVIPQFRDGVWRAFLPASGMANLSWKSQRGPGQGKLFFTSKNTIDSSLGVGLLNQIHQFEIRVLQGKMEKLTFAMDGAGEILEVNADQLLGWNLVDGDPKQLELLFNEAITGKAAITIRTQSGVDDFPAKAKLLHLRPQDAVRHFGFVRLAAKGAVRIEPLVTKGLTQLAAEQFPGEVSSARQAFHYRFPSDEFDLQVSADRVQAEVNVSHILVYELNESDRSMLAAIEMDVREAPIREWSFHTPADYSVVAVSGAAVADYVLGTENLESNKRLLKVLFQNEVQGRQLVTIKLEKNDPPAPGDWILPRLDFPQAKSVRGDLGIATSPGYRVSLVNSDLLTETPVSQFPQGSAGMQLAFRIRDADWRATLALEALPRSVQSDVFHLYSLADGKAYVSVLFNFFVSGSPVSEWKIQVPDGAVNLGIEGRNVRTWSQSENGVLTIALQQAVMGDYQLLLTFEQSIGVRGGLLALADTFPQGVSGERGYVQVVSPSQVKQSAKVESPGLLKLDATELPPEFSLFTSAPALGTWQYTDRPFDLAVEVEWFEPGTPLPQVVEYLAARSKVSSLGEIVTELEFNVKSQSNKFRIRLPEGAQLWQTSVDGKIITPAEVDGMTSIPLTGEGTVKDVMKVKLHYGQTSKTPQNVSLALPIVPVPILDAEWEVLPGDESLHLSTPKNDLSPEQRIHPPTGFEWVSRSGLRPLTISAALLLGALFFHTQGRSRFGKFSSSLAVIALIGAAGVNILSGLSSVHYATTTHNSLKFSLPAIAADESIALPLQLSDSKLAALSLPGVGLALVGLLLFIAGRQKGGLFPVLGISLMGIGILMQERGGFLFFFFLALVCLMLLVRMARGGGSGNISPDAAPSAPNPAAPLLLLLIPLLGISSESPAKSPPPLVPAGTIVAHSITQSLQLGESSADATGTAEIKGKPGDRFVLLHGHDAVLTKFETDAPLQVARDVSPDGTPRYVVTIANADDENPSADVFRAEFAWQTRLQPGATQMILPTGVAAYHEVEVSLQKPSWEILCPAAARIEPIPDANTAAKLILMPRPVVTLSFRPQKAATETDATHFFVEGMQVFLPSPGVIDGRHRFRIRPQQGRLTKLEITVPDDLTVSDVLGPVGSWRYDADAGQLSLALDPPPSQPFEILVHTQRGLAALPTESTFTPLSVTGATAETGLLGLAFGSDAQPESVASPTLSKVNSADFDPQVIDSPQAVLHHAFSYGKAGGALTARIAPVSPEVRISAQEVLSLGDERILLQIDFSAQITRAGVFQLSFPLPAGLEVQSLTGAALNHWSEVGADDQRLVILHLNGQTLGTHTFSLTLEGPPPAENKEWEVPRFEVTEAVRHTADLIVIPTTGLRLNTVPSSRKNVSEIDSRTLNRQSSHGSLAFRLLQKDWKLALEIEKLAPWVTGEVLHETILREGQTRTAITAQFLIQNASLRSLPIRLPIEDQNEAKTVRATGPTVGDFIPVPGQPGLWELQLKRRMLGTLDFQINFEKRGERSDGQETITALTFPSVGQVNYFAAVRLGGRLELASSSPPTGWQASAWNLIPEKLRSQSDQTAPSLILRNLDPNQTLDLVAQRYSLADALKLRVKQGKLTTILSPRSDALSRLTLDMLVVQRSSLIVTLPAKSAMMSILVNDESVRPVRVNEAWQFYILPGSDGATAQVEIVWHTPHTGGPKSALQGPGLNAPIENFTWQLIAPKGYEMKETDSDLERIDTQVWQPRGTKGKSWYDAKIASLKSERQSFAEKEIQRGNEELRKGELDNARRAFNRVAVQSDLDAATNEDARVQLENLQTQQAIVALQTRRQRNWLDHGQISDQQSQNAQLAQSASANPILFNNEANFRPDEFSRILEGNTAEENDVLERLANRIVQQQRSTDLAPPTMTLVLPEEGTVFTYQRTMQIAENSPLKVTVELTSGSPANFGRILILLTLLATIGTAAAKFLAPRRLSINSETKNS